MRRHEVRTYAILLLIVISLIALGKEGAKVYVDFLIELLEEISHNDDTNSYNF